MTIQDVFGIKGRGLVATGQIESGSVRVGDELQIDGDRSVRVKAVEMFRKKLDVANAGDNVGLLFDDEDVARGVVLTGPGAMQGAEELGLT